MAAFRHFVNMYDVTLKPPMLRSLIRERIPAATRQQPNRDPVALSNVVSALKTHRLLSESSPESTDPKVVESWKSAVDAWFDRLLSLVSCETPDKCLAGVYLLGVAFQECSSARFLASYTVWFDNLLSCLQLPAGPSFVKVACLDSILVLFTRLAVFPSAMKDGTSLVGRLIQPILDLLNKECSEAMLDGALKILSTLITFFPASIRRNYDSLEDAIIIKITSRGEFSIQLLEKFADCLALLPVSRGDGDSWSLMMKKIINLLNAYLNDAFEQIEEESKRGEFNRLISPPHEGPPAHFRYHMMLVDASDKMRRSEQLVTHSVSSLMHCCGRMLTRSYPAQVNVPIRSLLALVRRVLLVDGSLSQSLRPYMTVMQQEFVCSQLPILHSCSLEVLTAIIKGVRSQLLPHAADIARLLTYYFNTCAFPELRIQIYSIFKTLIISMGVGIAVYLAQDIVSNAAVDLESCGPENDYMYSKSYLKSCTETLPQPSRKKRKHVTTTEIVEQQNLDVEVQKCYSTTPIPLKIAALEALKSLLTVVGCNRSKDWRSKIDLLLFNVAMRVCKGGWASEENRLWADFQLAALAAFLASLLSPARTPSPYLAQGLELFRKGKLETRTTVAEFCAQALLALDCTIHPRAIPLDFPSASQKFQQNGRSVPRQDNVAFNNGFLGMEPVDSICEGDELYTSWSGASHEIENSVRMPAANVVLSKDSSKTLESLGAERPVPVNGSFGITMAQESEQGPVGAGCTVEMGENHVGMVESQQAAEAISGESVKVPALFDSSTGMEVGHSRFDLGSNAIEDARKQMASSKDASVAKGDGNGASEKTFAPSVSELDKKTYTSARLENEASDDSFPDIVDSDSDSE